MLQLPVATSTLFAKFKLRHYPLPKSPFEKELGDREDISAIPCATSAPPRAHKTVSTFRRGFQNHPKPGQCPDTIETRVILRH